MVDCAGRHKKGEMGMSRRLWAAPMVLCAAFTLAACGDIGRFQTASPATTSPAAKPIRTVAQSAAAEREHERILSSYGGAYDDPKLEALIGKTVDRLVAASDRPDQAYKVTILNSGAVNAFALPTGQLYVTRGLIALACDTSELSSVLSHEMAHVLAKHASIREDQARQAAVVTRVVTESGQRSGFDRAGAGENQIDDGEFFATPRSLRPGAAFRRRHFIARPFRSVRRGAFPPAMERNAELKAGKTSVELRARRISCRSHPATPERIANAQNTARQYTSPEANERDRETYLAAIDNIVYGEDPSGKEPFVAEGSCTPNSASPSPHRITSTLDNTAQAVIGVREGGTQAMRFDVVRVPSEQSLGDYLNSGWMENVDKACDRVL